MGRVTHLVHVIASNQYPQIVDANRWQVTRTCCSSIPSLDLLHPSHLLGPGRCGGDLGARAERLKECGGDEGLLGVEGCLRASESRNASQCQTCMHHWCQVSCSGRRAESKRACTRMSNAASGLYHRYVSSICFRSTELLFSWPWWTSRRYCNGSMRRGWTSRRRPLVTNGLGYFGSFKLTPTNGSVAWSGSLTGRTTGSSPVSSCRHA